MRLDELAKQIDAELVGDGAIDVSGVATLENARSGQLSFLGNPKYAKQLETTQASAVIVALKVAAENRPLLKAKDPYLSLCKAIVALHGYRKHPFKGVHPQAHVDPTATIGEGTVVYPGAFVGPGAKIGRDCVIYASVAIYNDCVLGDRVIVHANTTIGSDGFGYASSGGIHHKIPQIGNVVIEDDVEIGAGTTIARGALESTTIGKGTKIDGQVMIGHGVKVGPGCVLVAQVGIAGSTTLGKYVTMAGQVGVAGHLEIGDMVTVGAQSGIMFDVEPNQTIVGSPAMPAQQARRVYSWFTKLPELAERVKELEHQIQELADSGDTPLA
jgi:UDP-3-O-[3-hydroxymyristoyl] glucosamine N-acyltransferase